jgi:hypothetical protein
MLARMCLTCEMRAQIGTLRNLVDTSGTPAGGRLVGGAAARPKAKPVQRAADLSSDVPIDHSEVEDDEVDEEEDDERRSAVCVAR